MFTLTRCEDPGVRSIIIRVAGLAFSLAAVSSGGQAAPLIDDRDFDCVIESQQTVKLASSALGVIASLDVDRGDLVRKGQVLGKLDNRVEVANLALAEAK